MEIAEHCKLPFLRELNDKLLGIVNARVQNFRRGFPSAIQITARETASVVSIYHTVRVQHRNYFEHKVLPQQLSLRWCWICQEVQRTLHHPRPYRLSWVNPCSHYNTFALGHVLRILFAGDREDLNFVSCQSITQCFSNTEIGFYRVSHDAIQVIQHVGVCVRVAICEVHSVVGVFKVVAESLRIVSPLNSAFVWPAEAVWVIADIRSSTVPTDIFVSSHSFAVD